MNLDLAGNEDSRRSCVSHTSQILWRHGSVGVLDDVPINLVSKPRFQANMVVGHLASLRFKWVLDVLQIYAGGWFSVRAFLCFFWPMGWVGVGWGGLITFNGTSTHT